MRPLVLASSLLLAAPAVAEVTHSMSARFGVGYRADQMNPHGSFQSLYEGRYTSSFTHQADNGIRFRFDFEIEVGNFDSPRRGEMRAPGVSIGLGGD